jgi:hypothetical protein
MFFYRCAVGRHGRCTDRLMGEALYARGGGKRMGCVLAYPKQARRRLIRNL